MHRKRKLKSPFVLTAAATVASASMSMLACTGGAAERNGDLTGALTAESPATSNPPAPTRTEPTPDVVPEPHVTVTTLPDCPSTAPAVGGACTPSQSCQYNDTGCTVIRACDKDTSRWQDRSPTCNPPPPPVCPATMPTIGSPCDGDLSCSYELKGSSCPEPQVVCSSATKTWQHVAVSCNPPPPPVCPADLPKGGSPCDGTLECEYPNGTGCPGPTAVCNQDTGTWLIAIAICNPPPPQLPER